ncbi:MAG: STT3 domain-containing protein, partial [bacterium]
MENDQLSSNESSQPAGQAGAGISALTPDTSTSCTGIGCDTVPCVEVLPPSVASPGSSGQPRRRKSRWLIPLIFLAVMLFGLFSRVEDFSTWRNESGATFFDNKPLLGALDGYFYLRMARDLLEHTYTTHDILRNAPDGYPRPWPPPLISCMAAGISRVTGWQLDWVGFFLPAFLGSLLAIPLYAFGRYLSCPAAGIAAALAGLVAPYVIYRGGMGWFDTDCMNVTWTLATAYCFMRFSHDTSTRRYRWLLSGFAFTGLFLWWWDQARGVVLVLSLLPMVFGLVLFYRPRSSAEWAGLALVVFTFLLLSALYSSWLSDQLGNCFALTKGQIQHITKHSQGDLPKFALSISEQNTPSFRYIIDATTCSITAFILSALGFVLLALRKKKIIMFLLPTFVLAILSITYAERFLIFLTPLLALGFGYIVGGIWKLHWLHRGLAWAAVVAAGLALSSPLYTLLTAATAWPKTEASRVAGMVQMAEQTPTNALIWTLWDNGYAVNYFARRATISDGQIHGLEQSRIAATPMATTNSLFAARFMRFYAAYGRKGIQRIRPVDRDNPESYPVPTMGRPVYMFLDSMTMATVPIWYAFGTSVTNDAETVYQPFYGLLLAPDGVYGPQGLIVDTGAGILRDSTNYCGLRQFMAREAEGAWIKEYDRKDGGCFE